VVDQHYDTWINVLGNPIVKLYILALIALSFFHFAHRLRYLLVDFGVHAAKKPARQVIFYAEPSPSRWSRFFSAHRRSDFSRLIRQPQAPSRPRR